MCVISALSFLVCVCVWIRFQTSVCNAAVFPGPVVFMFNLRPLVFSLQ